MKKEKQRVWSWDVALTAVWLVALFALTALWFTDRFLFWIGAAAAVLAAGLTVWRYAVRRQRLARCLVRLTRHFRQVDEEELESSPFPALASSESGEILWYNRRFREQVLSGGDRIGESIAPLFGGAVPDFASADAVLEAAVGDRRYSVLHKTVALRETLLQVLYFWDDTQLRRMAEEYTESRPAVLSVYIDNLDELAGSARDSERAKIAGRVETLLEDWIGETSGLIRKYDTGRFLVIVEHRYLQKMLEDRFSILDRVRAERVGDVTGITLSIGIGQGADFRTSEQMARQALEMALGRGGDQAAVRTQNGFDFYGGISRGVERRTKVRTRVIASALRELMLGSDLVITMGHRFSDLDCVGSAVAAAVMARELGKPAYVAVNRDTTLAGELLERYDREGRQELFIDEERALAMMTGKTLLIVTDTHNPRMLEFPAVYQAARQVAVIDHHRKMVEHIDNAVIFFHEPYASSASEMVTELAQYMEGFSLPRMEAEGLLAGMVLDTRSFSMKAGVRTFEAAAYLRKRGADTVSVQKMFAGSMELYRRKTEIMSHAEVYKNTVIACTEESGTETRVAASQAANELLSIKGVEASFALFRESGGVNISARSYGDFNVQLVMESLGGGGHLTMAGAYLKDTGMEEAVRRLKEAVSERLAEREQALPARLQEM